MNDSAKKTETEKGDDMSIAEVKGKTDAAESVNDNTVDAPASTDAADTAGTGAPAEEPAAKDKAEIRQSRQISLSVRGLAVGSMIVCLAAAVAVMTWLYIGANHNYEAQLQQLHDNEHAEQVALDYAVRAAIMDYEDLGPWKRALVEGTTDELGKKLTEASTAMEQILLPLEWSSSAKPIAAKVRSHENGVYVVDAFVSVMTKTIQAAEDLQSTATYSVTIDPSNDWKISDVGGIGQVVGE